MQLSLAMVRFCLALAVIVAAAWVGDARAQDFLAHEWILNPHLSKLYMLTEKNNAVFETQQFTALEGRVDTSGEASVKVDLNSIDTSIDVRDVRMRFLLFETFKFPSAEITAKLDKDKLAALATETRVAYPLDLQVNMHGVVQNIKTTVWVTRLSAETVSVTTVKPIIVTAESFGLTGGIAKLMDAVNGIPIAAAASISFDLVFGTDNPALAAGAPKTEPGPITAEACETRFDVISKTGAIYFRSNSAELDPESEPLLNTVVEIAGLCPSVHIEVEGHTDNVGSKRANQRLSEQRAKAVVDYLVAKGIAAGRIQSVGYGDTRPVASNDTEAGRAKNRRIEFTVKKT